MQYIYYGKVVFGSCLRRMCSVSIMERPCAVAYYVESAVQRSFILTEDTTVMYDRHIIHMVWVRLPRGSVHEIWSDICHNSKGSLLFRPIVFCFLVSHRHEHRLRSIRQPCDQCLEHVTEWCVLWVDQCSFDEPNVSHACGSWQVVCTFGMDPPLV